MLLFTQTLILCFTTGRLLENTVPALDILGVLLDDTGLCYSAVYDPLYMFPCPRPERGLLRWRERCIGKMIMESEVTDIRDKTLQ